MKKPEKESELEATLSEECKANRVSKLNDGIFISYELSKPTDNCLYCERYVIGIDGESYCVLPVKKDCENVLSEIGLSPKTFYSTRDN